MYTSFSSASLQIGSLCARQNALLHVIQVAAVDRVVESSRPLDECDDSGMIVLLTKHVHLQNEGGAGYDQQDISDISLSNYLQAANVDTMIAHNAKKMYRRFMASIPVRSFAVANQ